MKFNFKSFRLGDFLSKRINTILLIAILIIILTGHVVCSCSKVSAFKVVEKLTGMRSDGSPNGPVPLKAKAGIAMKAESMNGNAPYNSGNQEMQSTHPLLKQFVKNKIAASGTSTSTSAPTTPSSATPSSATPSTSSTGKPGTTITIQEKFTPANTNYGQSSPYLLGSMGGYSDVDTNSWNQSDLSVKHGGSYGSGVADILNRPSQPIPLPEGEMLMFANTQFKPECCKNNGSYSGSTGCACMTTGQYNYLVSRGGNNVPYSEY
jgi:hypothetical protein